MSTLEGYSDGACKGDKRGGWGAYLVRTSPNRPTITFNKCGGKKVTTNQEMELTGALELLKMIDPGCPVTVFMDSEYVLKGLISDGKDGFIEKGQPPSGWTKGWAENGWKTRANGAVKHQKLWEGLVQRCKELVDGGTRLRLCWVKGHSGNEGNEAADQLANLGVPNP
jgi:ribonuclease HI